MHRIAFLLGVSLLLAGTVHAAAPDRFDDLRAHIRAEMARESIPSIAVAVAKDGAIVWEEGFGWADRERQIPATAHTMYSVASVSKPITATGLMTLVQAGKVDLDKPANDYLGPAQLRARIGDARDATVRRLANHSSGLPLHYRTYFTGSSTPPPSVEETLLRYGNLVTAPGERAEYSNLGFGAIDYLIERVSGRSYAEFMRREVFLPLGMTRSSVGIGPGLAPYAAARYGAGGTPIPFYELDTPGAGSIYASAHDLLRFTMFHLKARLPGQKAILSDASIDEMHRSTSPDGYGVGFGVSGEGGHLVIGHSGGMPGAASRVRLLPDQGLAVVVLSNTRTRLSYALADKIIATMVPGWTAASEPPRQPSAPFTPPADLVGRWKGTLSTYVGTSPVELDFRPGGEVRAKLGEQPESLVERAQWEDGVFSGSFASRIQTPDAAGYDHKVTLSLTLRGKVLNGSAMAIGTDKVALSGDNVLAHWLELKRQ